VAGSLLACMIASAVHYRLPPRVLPSIQVVEGGATGVVHNNTDGSVDMGVMQINSRWILPIAKVAHLEPSDVARRLLLQPCFNIASAALILRTALDRDRGDMMRAIGDYHSHTPALNLAYQARVYRAAIGLYVRPRARVAAVQHGGKDG